MPELTHLQDLDIALYSHLVAASLALCLGPFAIYRRRRDVWHRTLGYTWVLAMLVTAISSFWLHAAILHFYFGFGAIHLLAIWVIVQVTLGVRDARAGRIEAHRARMAGLYWQGLSIAGLLTLLPGRLLNDILFGNRPEIALWVIAGFGAGLLWVAFGRALRPPPVAQAPDQR